MKNWQESFGITKSDDPYALFKFSDQTTVGKLFWENADSWDFLGKKSIISSIEESYFDIVKEGTGFSKFYISDGIRLGANGGPSVKLDQTGIGLDFGNRSDAISNDVVLVQQGYWITITINGINLKTYINASEGYTNNFWDSARLGKNIIER